MRWIRLSLGYDFGFGCGLDAGRAMAKIFWWWFVVLVECGSVRTES
jgi:hypothetical protein